MRTRRIVALCLILAVIGSYVVYEQLTSSITPYTPVSELMEKPSEYYGRQVQVTGIVKEGSVERVGATLTFILADNRSSIEVTYFGVYPSGFQEGNEVVVIGTLQDSVLQAEKVLVKCPSKYEELPEASE
ncbi:cytochrome c maturation protein CcmE [Candidatus Hecatella orcuttiae]|uniref:cytochrome c maturation protein CcmE n=1 Tax=Candidatus Hecatella orcuttiae TaxID=1935119 RepID=UPI0028682CB3|nr:cytochrome c maturation protein CcmE [Candidatus Hecatella orcuttiae]